MLAEVVPSILLMAAAVSTADMGALRLADTEIDWIAYMQEVEGFLQVAC